MNAVATSIPHPVTNADRMGVALLFSLMLHGILILGIGWHFAKPAPSLPTLDVTLINTSNAETPKQADFLAQANNAGGGNSDKAHRPGAPFSGPLPVTQAGIAPVPLMPAAPAQQTQSGPHILTTTGAAKTTAVQQRDTRAEPAPQERVAAIPVQQRLEMARLAQEVRDEQQAYARRPRRKYISANTRSVADAAYQVAWVHRIERIGNLNYPDAARRRHLHGNVVLSVTIGADGHVRGVTINTSSGYRVLDDAAIRIVHLAAPFPPIPREKDADGHRITELVITRTWQFLPGNHLQTRGTAVP
ncbi:MAG: energy transducer TonB [Rhodanobacteraceae bacterium]|nr:MAG: energy transducer TonB [Rhodanobacteraceae bacterium]